MVGLASALPWAVLGCLLMTTLAAQSAPSTEPFLEEIRAFEEADAKAPPPHNAVLFLGSSSIQKWSSLRRDFPNFKVINRGFGGSTIAQSTHYAPHIV